ncbi:MAG: hypothetical protein N0C84_22530 [Candidatus Thiodiazotropha taylori]|uniref:Uncharacterized protein n=1 Tax=Candidatus Thiodiazotropha taylori TaxID=2792791 RepID=A0A9E4N7Y0_9GAMM|nr:hypothetical protein [Candidatus Thiodiazotropha taylori]MCW4259245.1 hypothetical protein [Candidatus Thiodiazotropha taylori]
MADLTSQQWGSLATTLVGSISDAYSTNLAGRTNAAIARIQAKAKQRQAQQARDRGRLAAYYSRLKTRKIAGAAKAGIAANGFATDSGSALDVMSDIAQAGKLDELIIRHNAEVQARGFESAGQSLIAGAEFDRRSASLNAMNTLVDGGLTVHSKWADYTR